MMQKKRKFGKKAPRRLDKPTRRLDPLSPAERSKRMSLVRGKDTKPELIVRRMIHAQGYRYRLHVPALPGNPDLVFPARKKVIFVHGCFWHRHTNCAMARIPKSRNGFWLPKLNGNRDRDLRNRRKLRALGYKILTLWECRLGDRTRLLDSILRFLEHA